MAETIVQHPGSVPKWHWYSVARDLEEQGGLEGVTINPLSMDATGCAGVLKGNPFFISWVHDVFMLLTMKEYSQELVDAFAKVLEYRPFCRYNDENGLPTVEWAKLDSERRFEELAREGRRELQKFELAA